MKFVNPYTFIPLAEGTPIYRKSKAKLEAPTNEELLTGVIRCSFVTKTPLCVPDVNATDQPGDENKLSFFKIGDTLAIPGSSLRGAFRSVYETLTDSCLRTNDERLHSTSSLKKPGLLTWDGSGYVLLEAERLRIVDETLAKPFTTGQHVFFCAEDDKRNKNATSIVTKIGARRGPDLDEEGYFLRVHKLNNHPSVFTLYKDSFRERIDDEDISCFSDNINLFVENNGSSAESMAYKACFEALKGNKDAALPVWYAKSNGSYQLAPSQLSRSVYRQTPTSLAEARAQCTSIDSLCPACTLFGFVPPNGRGQAKAGRVRFSDATAKGSPTTTWSWLPNLMEPRQSSFEFYLRNSKPDGRRSHDFTPADANTRLAGRKAYWHHQAGTDWNHGEQTEYNAKAELVGKGESFSFDVYVDRVTKMELNQLVYALTFGQAWGPDTSGNTYCHQLGHGKPVGLGSVMVSVDKVVLRTCSGADYALVSDDGWRLQRTEVERTLRSISAVKAVAAFGAIPSDQTISYPRIRPGDDIFTWFSENRNAWVQNGPIHYKEVLDERTDHVLGRDDGAGGSKRRGASPGQRGRGNTNPQQHAARTTDQRPGLQEGEVKLFKSDKGFGFIKRKGKSDLFFHVSQWRGASQPQGGQKVTFTEGDGTRGPQAMDVSPL